VLHRKRVHSCRRVPGVQVGTPHSDRAEARTSHCFRRCRRPAPACCCQPGAPCHEDTPCSFRPEGRSAAAAIASLGRNQALRCRHADWIESVKPSGERTLRSPSHRGTPCRPHARGVVDTSRPCVCAGFPVRAPSLHRCLSTAAHPRARVVRIRPRHQRRAFRCKQLLTSADRLQGLAPPTSP
jgi:hypothetical protein